MAVKNVSMYFQQNLKYQRVSLKCVIPHTVNSHMTRFVYFLFALREEEDCKKACTEKVSKFNNVKIEAGFYVHTILNVLMYVFTISPLYSEWS